ncbi:MAG: site-specific DNA-methyltransferase [Candidatus Hydrogenedentes bacterium]|nr:site-specific DNA-methyltransferase [Candidatus Hydrogenedentota bacterium]
MPTLDWIGKKAVENHHKEVPYRLLKCNPELSVGEPGSGNLLVQGDNLEALKGLLPYYGGKVKCIYIDPPYNTGNENWVYNDAVNSPEMRQWLGEVVGRDDLSRHDKWLCMMYPRLALLREFLTEDGAIFISIDDNEVQNLRAVMDELFGEENFITTVIWQKVYSPKNSARHFSEDHDFVIVYARDAEIWKPKLVSRSEKQDKAYKNRDNDPRGPWKTSDLSARNFYGAGTYAITCPSGRLIPAPPTGRYWTISEQNFRELDADNRIWWGKDGSAIPQMKRFLSEVKRGVVPQTLWKYDEVGHTQEAKQELVSICDFADSNSVFITPKPVRLVKRILDIATDRDSIVLDSFAGSGTTGQAVLEINKADGGSRRFMLVELDQAIACGVTTQRIRRAVEGYEDKKHKRVAGLGGGFRYCELGETLFDAEGSIRSSVSFADLASHVFFTEMREPLPKPVKGKTPLIGVARGTAVYLLYNGVLKDKNPKGGNVLTLETLRMLTPHDGPKIVYGTACTLGAGTLKRYAVTFRQIPYEVKAT